MEQTTRIGNVYNTAGGSADLSNYYTKEQTDAQIANLKSDLINGAEVDLDSFKEVVDYVNNYIESDETAGENILTQIAGKADADKVYTKEETDAQIDADVAVVANNLANNYYTKTQVYQKSEVDTAIQNVDVSSQLTNFYPKTETYSKTEIDTTVLNINTAIEGKQNKLTAGENITISEDGVISSTGGGSSGGSSEGGAEMIFSDVADETGTPLRTIKVGEDVWSIPEGGSGGGSSAVSRKAYEVLLNMGADINTDYGSTGSFDSGQIFSYTGDLRNKKWMLCLSISNNQGNTTDCRTPWNGPAATEITSSSGIVGLSLNDLNSWYSSHLSLALGRYIFHFSVGYASGTFIFSFSGFNAIKYYESDEEQESFPSSLSIYPKYLIVEE